MGIDAVLSPLHISFADLEGDGAPNVSFKAMNPTNVTKFFISAAEFLTELSPSLASDEGDEESASKALIISRLILKYSTEISSRPMEFIRLLTSIGTLLSAIDAEAANSTQLKSTLCQILEHVVADKDNNFSEFYPDILRYLLLESLKPVAKDPVIKRLNNSRLGFLVLDMHHTESNGVRNLLLRAFANPLFLKTSEGNNFLVFILQNFAVVFMEPVATIIRNNLIAVSSAKELAKIYGHLLQKSLSADSHSPDIEETIQNFLHDAVYAADPKYFAGLRALIKSFHNVNRSSWLEDFLVRIFDPIIWRSMKCANSTVRSQASQLFLDVFPLQKQSSKPEECDAIIQKQFDQLAQLLKDADHKVRAIATRGVCTILREYWDALPISTIQTLLKYICDTLAVDTSSVLVRLAAISGIHDILSQPLSHSMMKNLLPLLSQSVYDKSDRVRLEFIKILITVKGLREIHFYDIVSVDTLFMRLVHERHSTEIVGELTSLLFNSFFPPSEQGSTINKEHVKRCLNMIDQNLSAAEVFYSQLHLHLPTGAIAKFVAMLSNVLDTTAEALQASAGQLGPQCEVGPASKNSKRSRSGKAIKEANGHQSQSDVAELADKVFGIARVLVGIFRGSFDSFCDEQPSLELLHKFITPERLSRVVDAVTSFNFDFDSLGAVFEIVGYVSKLPHCPHSQSWGETFNYALFEHVLQVACEATPRVQEVELWLANKAVDVLVANGSDVTILDNLLVTVSAIGPGKGSESLPVSTMLLQAYGHYIAKNINNFMRPSEQAKLQKLVQLQRKYFAMRKKLKTSDLTGRTFQFSLSRIFKSFVVVEMAKVAAMLRSMETSTADVFEIVDDVIEAIRKLPPSVVSGQELTVLLLSLIDLLHLVDDTSYELLFERCHIVLQMVETDFPRVMDAPVLAACIERMSVVVATVGNNVAASGSLKDCMSNLGSMLERDFKVSPNLAVV